MEDQQLLTATEAATYAQTTRQAINLAIKEGRLQATKFYGRWLVDRTDLRLYMARAGLKNGWQTKQAK